jgi:hypothetical protein
MTERLRLIDADIDAVRWDAYRSDDGTWQITGEWRAGDKAGTVRWSFDLPSRTVSPFDAATMDFAEGTRLVRVVPDVPVGQPAAPTPRGRPVSVLRDAPRADEPPAGELPPVDGHVPAGPVEPELVRDVHPPVGSPDDDRGHLDTALLDEVADHDTVVLGRTGEEPDSSDPRARIPAWEDIVFGVRRHR